MEHDVLVIMRVIFVFFLLFFPLGQPVIEDGLIRDLLCLFIQQTREITTQGSFHYRHSFEREHEILQISLEENEHGPLVDDSPTWRIAFTHGEFNPYLTSKSLVEDEITDIENIVHKHGVISIDPSWTDGQVFSDFEVQQRPILENERALLSTIVRSTFGDVDGRRIENRIPFIAVIVIDTDGKASFEGFLKRTGDKTLDKLAERAIAELCKEQYSPAIHRGKAVKCKTAIVISKKDISNVRSFGS